MRRATLALVEYDHTKSSAKEAKIEKAVMLRSKEGVKLPSPYQAESTEWLADRRDSSKAVAGWEEVIGTQIPVLDIPGNHFEPFQPQNVSNVPCRLDEILNLSFSRSKWCPRH